MFAFFPSTLNRFESQSSNVVCVIVVLSVRVPVRVTEIYSVLLWSFCSICQGSVPLRMQAFKSSSPYITQVSLQSWRLSLQGLEFFMQETVWRQAAWFSIPPTVLSGEVTSLKCPGPFVLYYYVIEFSSSTSPLVHLNTQGHLSRY